MSVSVEEALEFLRVNPHVFLMARRADGFPTAYAMLAQVVDGAVEFSTYRSSAKVRNLLREGVASVTSVADDPGDSRVLVASGRVVVASSQVWAADDVLEASSSGVTSLETSQGAKAASYRAVPAEISQKVGSRHESGKRVVLRIDLDRARFSSKPSLASTASPSSLSADSAPS